MGRCIMRTSRAADSTRRSQVPGRVGNRVRQPDHGFGRGFHEQEAADERDDAANFCLTLSAFSGQSAALIRFGPKVSDALQYF